MSLEKARNPRKVVHVVEEELTGRRVFSSNHGVALERLGARELLLEGPGTFRVHITRDGESVDEGHLIRDENKRTHVSGLMVIFPRGEKVRRRFKHLKAAQLGPGTRVEVALVP